MNAISQTNDVTLNNLIQEINDRFSEINREIRQNKSLQGELKLFGNLNANGHRIINLPIAPKDDRDAITFNHFASNPSGDFGIPVDIGTANAEGSSTLHIRKDHIHKHPTGLGADLHHNQDHASRHENGGADEVSVAGLSGELADLQPPKDHTHQSAGSGVGGKLDHGLALNGLGDDDHTQYVLADGTRAFSGDWTNAGNTIADLGIVTTIDLNGGTIDGTNIGVTAPGTGKFSSLENTSTVGLIIPASTTMVFSRSGDSDTGVEFDVANTRFNLKRDGSTGGYADANNPLTYGFGSLVSPALIIPDNAYAFALASAKTTGVYFNNTSGNLEFHNITAVKHSFEMGNGDYSPTGDIKLLDNKAVLFGTGQDASMYYTGTDLVLNAQVVGSGHIILNCPKTTTGDPAGIEGKIYWNTIDNVIKMYADGAWRTLVSW